MASHLGFLGSHRTSCQERPKSHQGHPRPLALNPRNPPWNLPTFCRLLQGKMCSLQLAKLQRRLFSQKAELPLPRNLQMGCQALGPRLRPLERQQAGPRATGCQTQLR